MHTIKISFCIVTNYFSLAQISWKLLSYLQEFLFLSFTRYVDSIQDEEGMTYFANRILKHSTAAKPAVIKHADSTLTKTSEEVLQELASAHFPSHKPIGTKEYDKTKIPTIEIKVSWHTWITTKVKNCLLQFKRKKAAGPGGLKPIFFKYMPDKCFEILELLYKALILTSHTPLKWN